MIVVSATDQNDALASFSNYGSTSVDMAAPGKNILSTMPGNDGSAILQIGKGRHLHGGGSEGGDPEQTYFTQATGTNANADSDGEA